MNKGIQMVRFKRRARGVGLVAALAVLIILAAISVAVISFNTTQQASISLDEQQTRAYLAARSGIEWALIGWRKGSGSPLCNKPSASFAMPPGTSLSRFTVTVGCEQDIAAPGMIRLRANACNFPTAGACPAAGNPPSPDYVEREVIADLPATP